MSTQAIEWAVRQTAGGPTEKLLLVALADGVDSAGRNWLPPARLAAKAEIAEADISANLDNLEHRGLIKRSVQEAPWGGTQVAVTLMLPNRGARWET